MSYRPLDWSPVDRSADPIPGDPGTVSQGGHDYLATATAIQQAATSLAAIDQGDTISLPVDELMGQRVTLGTVPFVTPACGARGHGWERGRLCRLPSEWAVTLVMS
ncbi:MAG: hypothetical protein LBR33_11790 [Propionibacteriaceae bacterium]|nr:hypothetical protein [Propionibacteriaceae bacterium]